MGVECISPASVYKMQEASKDFFDNLLPFIISEGGKHEFQAANKAIDRATVKNHLRFVFN